MGSQLRGDENSGRAVSTADDTDGSSFLSGKAQGHSAKECGKYAQLGSCAQKHILGVGDQRTKVGHGANAHENQTGIQAGFYTNVENIQQTAIAHNRAEAMICRTVRIHKSIPQFLMVKTGHRQVGQKAAKGDAH